MNYLKGAAWTVIVIAALMLGVYRELHVWGVL